MCIRDSVNTCFNTNNPHKIEVESIILNSIDADGTADFAIGNFETSQSEFLLRSLGTGDVSFTESVALSNLFIGNIGTGDVSGFNVSADTCRVTIDGTGDVEVTARDVLIVDRRGTGSLFYSCLLYTSPSPRDQRGSRMPSSA